MTRKCPECGRVFDLLDSDDADESAYGHDCEGRRIGDPWSPGGLTAAGVGERVKVELTNKEVLYGTIEELYMGSGAHPRAWAILETDGGYRAVIVDPDPRRPNPPAWERVVQSIYDLGG
jgi:hypothetical protein